MKYVHWCFPHSLFTRKGRQMNGYTTFETAVHTDHDISGWEALGWSDLTRMLLLPCICIFVYVQDILVESLQPCASHPEHTLKLKVSTLHNQSWDPAECRYRGQRAIFARRHEYRHRFSSDILKRPTPVSATMRKITKIWSPGWHPFSNWTRNVNLCSGVGFVLQFWELGGALVGIYLTS